MVATILELTCGLICIGAAGAIMIRLFEPDRTKGKQWR
jgi:hypothetical protein